MATRARSGRSRQAAPEHRTASKQRVARGPKPKPKPQPCDTCAADAYLESQVANLSPSFNYELNFSPPSGQRLVIEFVTATVEVPAGESARLRMFTGFSSGQAGNFDLALTPQGIVGGSAVYTATHVVRAYTDGFLGFNINRDNAQTTGHALVCVSGYTV
jgi:hypothetical protein